MRAPTDRRRRERRVLLGAAGGCLLAFVLLGWGTGGDLTESVLDGITDPVGTIVSFFEADPVEVAVGVELVGSDGLPLPIDDVSLDARGLARPTGQFDASTGEVRASLPPAELRRVEVVVIVDLGPQAFGERRFGPFDWSAGAPDDLELGWEAGEPTRPTEPEAPTPGPARGAGRSGGSACGGGGGAGMGGPEVTGAARRARA